MERSFKEALEHRRSYYRIANGSPVSDKEIENILKFAIKNVPSAFNSQSSRVVLLLGNEHRKLWMLVKDVLREIVPADAFQQTENKINNSFLSGYGTVLFFEDESVVRELQSAFPTYEEKFPVWSQQTSAMHQLTVWTLLEDVGFGASLQHYNPLIDEKVRYTWNLPDTWGLIAELPFGIPVEEPAAKSYLPVDERIKIYKS